MLAQRIEQLQDLHSAERRVWAEGLLQEHWQHLSGCERFDVILCTALQVYDGLERHGDVGGEMVLAVPGSAIHERDAPHSY